MIPKLNGLEVLKIIREQAALPIIIMSAKDSDVDKALGLGLGGADDYIAKPFSMLEFSAVLRLLSEELRNTPVKLNKSKRS